MDHTKDFPIALTVDAASSFSKIHPKSTINWCERGNTPRPLKTRQDKGKDYSMSSQYLIVRGTAHRSIFTKNMLSPAATSQTLTTLTASNRVFANLVLTRSNFFAKKHTRIGSLKDHLQLGDQQTAMQHEKGWQLVATGVCCHSCYIRLSSGISYLRNILNGFARLVLDLNNSLLLIFLYGEFSLLVSRKVKFSNLFYLDTDCIKGIILKICQSEFDEIFMQLHHN